MFLGFPCNVIVVVGAVFFQVSYLLQVQLENKEKALRHPTVPEQA
ncbi:Uncharacterised protein [Acinetobacter baumannii]|nr:Uncharacterised protein [Acinetobacter baumannii]